jgi:opine dehydrogenase
MIMGHNKIAVLGAGGTGHAIGADLTLAGFKVTVYEEPRLSKNLEEIVKRGGIKIIGLAGEGFAEVKKVTSDMEEALRGADVILVSVVASRHERIAQLCAPYLEDGQTILIGPDNGGTLVFSNIFRQIGIRKRLNVAGIAGNFYPCRLTGPAEVLVALPKTTKRIAAFPAKDTTKVLTKLKDLYKFEMGTNALEVALSSSNIVIHLPGSLLNTGAIEQSNGDYYLFRQGITPSVLRCIDAVKEERETLFKALDYTMGSSNFLEKVIKQSEFPELDMFRGLIGPTNMQHRYITEDAFVGQALMVSLGEMINIPTPVSKALITLASVINQRDYLKEGRTVEKLGLSGLSVDGLNRFLYEGDL